MAERNEYDAQARAFLGRFGLKLSATFKGDRCPPWCDGGCVHGDRYRIRISGQNGKGSISFDFWNSLNDVQEGRRPRAYEVLACISSEAYCPDTFEDYCAEYGYDEDSRMAEKSFKLLDKFARRLRAFFTTEELEALAEVQ